MFAGFSPEMLEFFLALRFNNNNEYFQENRARYEQAVQQPLRAFAEALAPTLSAIDGQFDVRPIRVVSRIRRDTRFSHNKDPFRDHMWLSWRYAGETIEQAMSFYWEITPETVRWGLGMYGEDKRMMDMVRRRIVAKPKELLAIRKDAALGQRFALCGNDYKRIEVPGEVPDDLRPLYIKKGFYLQSVSQADDFPALYSGEILSRVQADFQRLVPLYNWLRGRRQEMWDAKAEQEALRQGMQAPQ